MHLQNVIRALMGLLLVSVQCIGAKANMVSKVEALKGASALAILVDHPVQAVVDAAFCALPSVPSDTIKSPEDLAREATDALDDLSDPDSITVAVPLDSARLKQMADSLKAKPITPLPQTAKPRFVPNPTRALWLSLVLPGAGQIYNRKYWKLPFIYGGFLGCAYALMWNQMMYRDYSQAYLDIMDDDPNTKSYLDMLPPRYDITGREDQFKTIFKRKKDFYRRYRDLSAFCFVGVYLLSVVDAYVDAQLSVFDISDDLSLRVQPAVIGTQNMLGSTSRAAYGVGCSLNF